MTMRSTKAIFLLLICALVHQTRSQITEESPDDTVTDELREADAEPGLRPHFVEGPVPVTSEGVNSLADTFTGLTMSLPRFAQGGPAPKTPTVDDFSVDSYSGGQPGPWAQGVVSVGGQFMFLGILTWSLGILFCIFRFLCNCCGKRKRTKTYKKPVRWMARIGILVNTGLLAFAAYVGFQGNVGITLILDHAASTTVEALDIIFAFTDILDHGAEIGDDVLLTVLDINGTIIEALPSSSEVNTHKECLNDVFGVSDNAIAVQSKLQELDSVIGGLPDMLAINKTLGDLRESIDALPDLDEMANRIDSLNRTIKAMPSVGPLTRDLVSLNATLGSFGVIGTVTVQIEDLQGVLNSFNTEGIKHKLGGFDGFWDDLPDLDMLHSDMDVGPGDPFRNSAETHGALIQMQTALDNIPDIGDFMDDIRGLNTSINAISASLVLAESIRELNESLSNLPDLGGIVFSMEGFKEFMMLDFGLVPIQDRVWAANRSIAMQPNSSILEGYMVQLRTSVENIKAVDFANITATIRAFNASVGRIGCVGGVIGMIADINSSLVILPDEISGVFDLWDDTIKPQIDDIASQQESLQGGIDAIESLNDTLKELPDFDAIIDQIQQMGENSGDMPDLTQVYNDLGDLGTTLGDLPDMNEYINNVKSLNDSLQIDSLGDILDSLDNMGSQMGSMPDLQPQLDNMVQLNQTLSDLNGPLSAAIDVMAIHPSHAPGGFDSGPFLSGIESLNDTKASRPNNTDLATTLNDLNGTITTMPDLGETVGNLESLNNSLSTFPDIGELKGKIDSLNDSMAEQPDFEELSAQIRDLNVTVEALPDLESTQDQVLGVKDSADSANLNATISQLDVVADIAVDESVTDQLDMVGDLQGSISLDPMVELVVDGIQMLRNSSRDQQDFKVDTQQMVIDGVGTAKFFDGFRLAGMSVLLVFPLVVSVLGICSCICRVGCCAMCQALIFIWLATIYFIIGGAMMTPTVLLIDICNSYDELLSGVLVSNMEAMAAEALTSGDGGEEFEEGIESSSSSSGSVDTWESTLEPYDGSRPLYISDVMPIPPVLDGEFQELINYYFICVEQPVPAALVNLQEYADIAIAEMVNVTAILDEVEGASGMKLVPAIKDLFIELVEKIGGSTILVSEAVEYLDCHRFKPIFDDIHDIECVTLKNGLVLYTWGILLSAIFMCTGICCGICGHKRLQRQTNRVANDPNAPAPAAAGGQPAMVQVPAMMVLAPVRAPVVQHH